MNFDFCLGKLRHNALSCLTCVSNISSINFKKIFISDLVLITLPNVNPKIFIFAFLRICVKEVVLVVCVLVKMRKTKL